MKGVGWNPEPESVLTTQPPRPDSIVGFMSPRIKRNGPRSLRETLLPGAVVDVEDRCPARTAERVRIVDEHVDVVEGGERGLHDPIGVGFDADVCSNRLDPPLRALGADLCGGVIETRLVARDHQNVGTRLRERGNDLEADVLAGAADDRRLAVEPERTLRQAARLRLGLGCGVHVDIRSLSSSRASARRSRCASTV